MSPAAGGGMKAVGIPHLSRSQHSLEHVFVIPVFISRKTEAECLSDLATIAEPGLDSS